MTLQSIIHIYISLLQFSIASNPLPKNNNNLEYFFQITTDQTSLEFSFSKEREKKSRIKAEKRKTTKEKREKREEKEREQKSS